MDRNSSGAPAPQQHSKCIRTDRESRDALVRRMAAKGFGILRNNADGTIDFYRVLSFAVGDGGMRAWYQLDDNEIVGVPIVGYAAILISRGGAKQFEPSIEPVVTATGALEFAIQTAGHACIARDEAEARAARGMPACRACERPRGDRT